MCRCRTPDEDKFDVSVPYAQRRTGNLSTLNDALVGTYISDSINNGLWNYYKSNNNKSCLRVPGGGMGPDLGAQPVQK